MKFSPVCCCADVHLGNHKRFGGPVESSMNDRCRAALDVFKLAAQQAVVNGAAFFIVAGDLFDYSRPEAPLIAAVQAILKELVENDVMPILLVGNHDQVSNADGDHALSPLAEFATVVEKPTRFGGEGVEILCVPFQAGHARTWLDGAILEASQAGGPSPSAAGAVRLLVFHLGIKDAETAPWLVAAQDSIDIELLGALCEKHRIDYVFAGNWHDAKVWRLNNDRGTYVHQCGALVPTGWDNPGIDGYGALVRLGPQGVDRLLIPGPRFVKLATQSGAEHVMERARKEGHRLYVSFDADPDQIAVFNETIAEGIAKKSIVAGEVLPSQERAVRAAKRAAFAAKSSKTLHEALDGFVKLMPIPDHVDRTRVLERSRGYLR